MGMGHWEHNCIVNAMLHHYVWYISNTDEEHEDEKWSDIVKAV